MKATGERFIPGKMFKHSEIEHMHRYSTLMNVLHDKIVLDAACGTGYGSNMIASVAANVYGIDISQEAIDYAISNFGSRKNLSYVKGDITALPFPDNTFDVVVSFETIEHINEKMQCMFLSEIKRVLNPNGILIMSTPNKEIYTVQAGNAATEWHVKEFYENEFDSFLRSQFTYINYFQQYISKASYLLDGNNQNVSLTNIDENKKGKFIVAVAGKTNNTQNINLNSIYYYPDDYSVLNEACQIYYSKNSLEFNEEKSDIIEVAGKKGNIDLEIDCYEDGPVKSLRIDPLQTSCSINRIKLKILTSNNITKEFIPKITNADKIINNEYFFYHRDPQFIFEFEEEILLYKILLSYTVTEYNLDSYPFLLELLNKEREINTQRSTLFEEERQISLSERKAIAEERYAMESERKAIVEERIAVESERKAIAEERIAVESERKAIIEERNIITEKLKEIEIERNSFYNRSLSKRIHDIFKIT